jgi:hypothetical protein
VEGDRGEGQGLERHGRRCHGGGRCELRSSGVLWVWCRRKGEERRKRISVER